MVLQIVLIITLQYSELIHMTHVTFHNVIILIMSAVNKNKNEYYYNIFLEKGSHKDKSNTEYF